MKESALIHGPRRSLKVLAPIGASVVACASLAFAIASVPASAQADDTESTTSAYGFVARNSGLFPDTEWNTQYLNAGNRGCNSCHGSADNIMNALNNGLTFDHPVTRTGNSSTHTSTILDGCLNCHHLHSGDYGNYFADAVHTVHYSSTTFNDTMNGNCWSCHVITDAAALTEVGTTSWQLWEEVMYDGGLGGYPDTASNSYTQDFLTYLNHDTGYVTDVSVEHTATYEVEMYQDITEDLSDTFTALNHSGAYGEDELYDFGHTITINGVVNPTTFTYEDLESMEQTEVTSTMQCLVAGSAGHNIYNATYTGVKLSDLVEACGGLLEGTNAVNLLAWDGWVNCGITFPVEEYLDTAIVALTINGELLPYDLGGPMLIIAPGMGAGFNTKWPQEINFSVSEEEVGDFVANTYEYLPGDELNIVSAAWFADDGVEFKLGEPVELSGYAFAWATHVSKLAAIEFSTDYGQTWQRFEVPDDFDPYQWTEFNFSWTPEEAGTYVVKVHGVNEDGTVNETDGSIIVKVVE